jgi:hypothetical protein
MLRCNASRVGRTVVWSTTRGMALMLMILLMKPWGTALVTRRSRQGVTQGKRM